MVRLKAKSVMSNNVLLFNISIPYGAIKREINDYEFENSVFQFQFLMVRLKVRGLRFECYLISRFQFLMVRLKD